jgi:hypothetical protein
MKAILEKLKNTRWVALVAMHFCVFSIGLYGSALFWLVHTPLDVVVLTWGVLASLCGFALTWHWQKTLQ